MCMLYARMVTSIWAGKMWNSWRRLFIIYSHCHDESIRIHGCIARACMGQFMSRIRNEVSVRQVWLMAAPSSHHTTKLFCTSSAPHRNCGEICVACAIKWRCARACVWCFLVFILFFPCSSWTRTEVDVCTLCDVILARNSHHMH